MFMSKRIAIGLVLLLAIPLAPLGADTYFEDFVQADGAPEGWAVVTPTVAVESEVLTLAPGGAGEVDVFAGQGGTGLWFENITQVEFDMAFPGETAAWPYDHGGAILCAQNVAGRYANTCYAIDYLPRDNAAVVPGRFRLSKFINGAETPLTETEHTIMEYEGTWRIDIATTETSTIITLTVDDVEQYSFEDTEANRLAPTGYVGFWAYQAPAENKVAVDNLLVEHTPGACPTFLSDTVSMTEGGGNAFTPVRIPIGANATEAYDVTVTSQSPSTASPVDATLTFAVGDPLVKSVEIAPGVGGETLLGIEVDGEDCSHATIKAEVLSLVAFEETFTQDDGPPAGWYIASDTAEVINGELSLHAPGQPFLWYAIEGNALNVPKIEAVRCRIKFAQAAGPVGAHGGIYLSPAPGSARDKGYMIDVIERASDNGFRIYKDNLATVQLGGPRQPYVWDDQWHDWEVVFTPTGFTFTVDGGDDEGEANVTVDDLTYRGGYLSFWCYTGAAGQNLFVDDVRIEFGASPCPSVTPREAINRPVNPMSVFTVMAPFGSNLGGDYEVAVTSSAPEVAVPFGAVDDTLVLTFPQDGSLIQTFEAECLSPGTTDFILDAGGTSCLEAFATMTVREPGDPGFCDDFAQADGPPDSWTINTGDWQVASERMVVECASGGGFNETWIWAGNPSPRIEGTSTISFVLDMSQTAPDAVGRHGGLMFFADEPTTRWVTSGYEIDWIDREADRGYRLLRSDGGTHTVIAGPTGSDFELGTNWLIEIDGDIIRVAVDEQLIFEVEDPTYREGHFGLWTYCNTTRAVYDNLAVGTCVLPFQIGIAPNPSFTGTGGAVSPVGSGVVNASAGVPDSWRAFSVNGEMDVGIVPLAPSTLYPFSPATNAVLLRVTTFGADQALDDDNGRFAMIPGADYHAEFFVKSGNSDNASQTFNFGFPIFANGAYLGREPGGQGGLIATSEWQRFVAPTFQDPDAQEGHVSFRCIEDGGEDAILVAIPYVEESYLTHQQIGGNCDLDGLRSISDVICMVRLLYSGFYLLDQTPPEPPCSTDRGNAALLDVNGDTAFNSLDIVSLAMFLFNGGPPPAQGFTCFEVPVPFGCPESPTCQ